MFEETIREGFEVFAHDGEKAFGAVRLVRKNALVVYIENAGDYEIPFAAIADIHSDKVVLDLNRLEPRLKDIIRRAHSSEDPRI